MINLSNETDYKLIFKTKNLYNFFFLLTITLFIGVFLKISILSFQEKNSPLEELNNRNSKIFSPTIYDTAGNRLAYFFFVIVSWSVSSCLLAALGLDPITSITGSLSAIMNVGPGFGDTIGPVGNYSSLPDSAKYVLSMDMLLGRLEFLALVIIFTREYWKW